MPKNHAGRMIAAAAVTLAVGAVALHGCGEESTEPLEVQAKGAPVKHHLKLGGSGSTATGTLVSSRGGLSCTVRFTPPSQVTTTGTCEKDYKKDMVLVVTAAPPAGGTVSWHGCDDVVTENPLACRVTMSTDRIVNAAFAPPASAFILAVQGGSGGSGSVQSTPSGISCTITSGSTSSTCSSAFASGSNVSLRASAASGSFIKAWAGGGCENNGSGVGTTLGTCLVAMTQAQGIVVSFDTDANEALAGKWDSPIDWPHVAIHAHLLPNGKVMSYGRMATGNPVVWNPADGLFAPQLQPGDFFCSGHSFLPDGRLLVTGGHTGTDGFGTKTTYLFDFALNKWTRGADMRNGRWYPTNTTLANGEVLTVSGGDTAGAFNLIPEVWQSNGTWRALTGASKRVDFYPMMFVAPNGQTLMVGPNQQNYYLNTSGTGGWTLGPASRFGYRGYGSAVMYDAGKILVVGGNEGAPTNTAEIINLNAGATWSFVQPMAVGRRQLNATLLADGKVLVTGGSNAPGFNAPPTDSRVLAAELWDPDRPTEAWKQLSRMTHQRLYHSNALLLLDGRVLSVGSGEPPATNQSNDLTAEIFSPPYLFNGDGSLATRPSISSVPVSVAYGATFTVATPNPSSIAKVNLIRIASVTHSFDQNQRMNRLTFSATASGLSVVAPPSGSYAPPGHYMLFIVNTAGVPSVGKVIRVF